ncbi:MAG: alanine--tRNA ligase [Nitrososphaeria archaeon]
MSIDPKEFDLKFFKENGFVRQICKKCGAYFWAQQISDTCRESPCVENTFIGNSPTKIHLDLNNTRQTFLNFFEEKGHKIIDPYPVVARWRDDLFVTIASIVDFQPYVTNGELPPPANPLVVSQPCLRFEDIDNVGITSGRHLTIFEMGGAHAFNYPDHEIYWKDQTVAYHHELLSERFGVKSEKISYKEHVWAGGGNAGPAVEAIVDGLEISTLVFMCYKTENEKMIPTPVKTVDTGYGMERWSWLSRGEPTAFHSIFGPLLPKFLDIVGVRIDQKILSETGRLSGAFKVETPQSMIANRNLVAQRLGMSLEEYQREIEPFEKVCAILDHTKSLAFLLSEGVVPSNVKTGYLARMLLRRIYRILSEFSSENKVLDLMKYQIDYWGPYFKQLKEAKDEVLKLTDVEVKKYKRTLEREIEHVTKKLISIKKSNKKAVPMNMLVEFYESHGIHPLQVKEKAQTIGLEVQVPADFFSSMVKMHVPKIQKEETEELEEILIEEKVPTSERLFYKNTKLFDFEANVIFVRGKYVVLDRTAFYAESGGQLSDQGRIKWQNGESIVSNVKKFGGVIVHVVDNAPPLGTKVIGHVDKKRRMALSIHHTSTHIINGAARKVLGEHVWQSGAQKGVDESRLDITHYTNLTDEEVKEIERVANEVVRSDIPVEVYELPRFEAERKYGYRLYQGGAVPGKELRVVKIGDHDVEACGGTHLERTGEIGLIKITKVEHIQDGVERIIFTSGDAALRKVQKAFDIIKDVSNKLLVPQDKISQTLDRVLVENEELRKKVKRYGKRISKNMIYHITDKAIKISDIKIYFTIDPDLDENTHIEIGSQVIKLMPDLLYCALIPNKNFIQVVVFSGEQAQKKGITASEAVKRVTKELGGSGGGDRKFARGGGKEVDKTWKAEEALRRYIQEMI